MTTAEKTDEKKQTTISIPTALVERIHQRIKGTEFTSVSSYITYVLNEVLSETDTEKNSEEFSKEDEERVKARLRSLGYLD